MDGPASMLLPAQSLQVTGTLEPLNMEALALTVSSIQHQQHKPASKATQQALFSLLYHSTVSADDGGWGCKPQARTEQEVQA